MKRASTLTVLVLVILLGVSLMPSGKVSREAQAHDYDPPINSVNADKEMLYYDATSRDGALEYAVAAWNQLNIEYGGQGVNIREVADQAQATVIVMDKEVAEKVICGQAYAYLGAVDYIYLDKTWFSNATAKRKRRCVMHELGHLLGFAHNDLIDTSIMYPCSTCTSLNAPGPHDKQDYYNAWVLNQATPYG